MRRAAAVDRPSAARRARYQCRPVIHPSRSSVPKASAASPWARLRCTASRADARAWRRRVCRCKFPPTSLPPAEVTCSRWAFSRFRAVLRARQRSWRDGCGSSRGPAHLCARPDAVLQAVMTEGCEEDLYVSSALTTFNTSLAALDRILPVIATSSVLTEAAGALRELTETLRGIDAGAFDEREGWWPRVLDDVRHTLNFPFSAAFEYVDRARGEAHRHGCDGIGARASGGACLAGAVRPGCGSGAGAAGVLRVAGVHDARSLLRGVDAETVPAGGVHARLRLRQ